MRTLTDANVVACPEYAAPAISVNNKMSRAAAKGHVSQHTIGEKFEARGAAPY